MSPRREHTPAESGLGSDTPESACNFLVGMLIVMASLPAVGLAAMASPQSPRIAAVYPPWWSNRDAALAAASAGSIASAGAAPFVIVVRRADGQTLGRLRRSGAVLLLNAPGGGCQNPTSGA